MSSTASQHGQHGYAVVKAVLSGDTLVVMGRAVNGPPPELQLSLSNVVAPKLARGPSATDEPFAWDSRQFLRKLVLGKPVQFRQEGAKNSRQYGSIWLSGTPPENVALACVRAGWCLPATNEQGVDNELTAAAAEARDANRGVYAGDATARQSAVRSVKWSVDSHTIQETLIGTRKRAIIEFVRDGSNYRCMLLPDMWLVSISLAGVRCGRVNPKPAAAAASGVGDENAPAAAPVPAPLPFAEEAKFFVESRLLHREIELVFVSVDKFGNALCTVNHAAGKIAVELVKHGLGKISEPGLADVDPAEAAQLREAEKQAKLAKVRLWRGYEAPRVSGVTDREFEAMVVEVISGDQVSVQRWSDESAPETRLALSSVRAPRMPNARAQRAGEPWAVEARELLRKLALGKRCRVRVEYARDISTNDSSDKSAAQTRVFASVTLAGGPKPQVVNNSSASGHQQNAAPPSRDVAELLLSDGLLAIVTPRSSDERAERYDALIAAEKHAKARKVGMHSGKVPPPPAKIADLTGDARRARAFLPYLTRQRSHKAFVETVFTGSRIKLRFAGENCAVVFSLAACRSPAPASASRPEAEAGGDAARSFARRTLMQRTVEASVDDMDRNGVAIGSIALLDKSGDQPTSYETRLLSRGLAKLDRRRLEQQLPGSELGIKYRAWAEVEHDARSSRLGLWADAANIADFESAAEAKGADSGKQIDERAWPCKLADIVNGAHCFVHEIAGNADDVSRFDAVAAKMRALALPEQPLDDDSAKRHFRRGSTIAALFDGEWCRAKILEIRQLSFTLRYVDYGNVEVDVPASRLRLLDSALASLPPAAVECELAYIAVAPLDDEAGDLAARALHDLAWDKTLTALEHAPADDGRKRVVLKYADDCGDDDEDAPSVNERLVRIGLARVPSVAKAHAQLCTQGPQLVANLLRFEEQARSRRTGLWRYGDVDYSDDEN